MQTMLVANELRWRQVPAKAVELYEKAAGAVEKIGEVIQGLPHGSGFLDLWYGADANKLVLNMGDWTPADDVRQWKQALAPHCSDLEVADESEGYPELLKVAFRLRPERLSMLKEAYSAAARGLGQATLAFPSRFSDAIPGAPSPIANMIAGGMLAGGLGYGGGWLLEQLLPKDWKRRRLRRTLALAGGLAGMSPGLLWGGANMLRGKRFNDPSLLNHPPVDIQQHLRTLPSGLPNPKYDFNAKVTRGSSYKDLLEKQAATGSGFGPLPPIPVVDTMQMLYGDPFVSMKLPSPIQAGAGALIGAASRLKGGARLVSPLDMAKITAGIGSGYLSGLLVGKTLGALMGMPESVQSRLRRTGMYAGAIANVVPLAFNF